MTIHYEIINKVYDDLEKALITDIPESDDTRAGVIKLGDLQGEPDPDVARISVTVHENDPDHFAKGQPTETLSRWMDEIEEIEIGVAVTWRRCFTVKARCLFETTKESLDDARRIASTVRSRIEHTLPTIDFSSVSYDGETVTRRIITPDIESEMYQSGGPPDSYDFFIKVRFDVLTTSIYQP